MPTLHDKSGKALANMSENILELKNDHLSNHRLYHHPFIRRDDCRYHRSNDVRLHVGLCPHSISPILWHTHYRSIAISLGPVTLHNRYENYIRNENESYCTILLGLRSNG